MKKKRATVVKRPKIVIVDKVIFLDDVKIGRLSLFSEENAFLNENVLTAIELRAIADELDRLNNKEWAGK